MAEQTERITKSKRGLRYQKNPFIGNAIAGTKTGVKRIAGSGNRMMVVAEDTGEIVAPAGFWQSQEVDRAQFVKLYINGVKAFKDLSNSGTKVFEVLYMKVQENIGKDVITLNFSRLDQQITPMSETTFYRGMKELLGKQFIAESVVLGDYFLNPDYMWNGDRLAFVKTFTVKNTQPKRDTLTMDLFAQPKAMARADQERET